MTDARTKIRAALPRPGFNRKQTSCFELYCRVARYVVDRTPLCNFIRTQQVLAGTTNAKYAHLIADQRVKDSVDVTVPRLEQGLTNLLLNIVVFRGSAWRNRITLQTVEGLQERIVPSQCTRWRTNANVIVQFLDVARRRLKQPHSIA